MIFRPGIFPIAHVGATTDPIVDFAEPGGRKNIALGISPEMTLLITPNSNVWCLAIPVSAGRNTHSSSLSVAGAPGISM
jgi:hypothetical protein